MKVKIVSREWLNDVEFYYYTEENGRIFIAKPVEQEMILHERGVALSRPTFTIPYDGAIEFVQSVISEAKSCYLGTAKRFREENVFEAEEIKILKEELADWKKLALTLLGAG
jgi:hypothetical protein